MRFTEERNVDTHSCKVHLTNGANGKETLVDIFYACKLSTSFLKVTGNIISVT